MDPIEIEEATALRPVEILTAYRYQDKGLIFWIEKYRPYNNEFYSQHQELLKGSAPTVRHQFRLHITIRELSENETLALERLRPKIYQLFVRVPYTAWVRAACGIISDEVLDFQVEARPIYDTLQTYIRQHPGKLEGSRVIEQQKRIPFAHLFTSAREGDIPEINVDLITHPIREYVNDASKTLAQILQRIDDFETRFKEYGYRLFWDAIASDDSSRSDMTIERGYACPKRENPFTKSS